MKIMLAFSLIVLLTTACEKEQFVTDADTEHLLVPATSVFYRSVVYDTTVFDTITTIASFARVSSEDSFLLEARRYVDPIPEAVDDESTNVLSIPLANDQRSFSYRNEELTENGVFLSYEDCFCARFAPYPVTGGTLSGTRDADGGWIVTGTVNATNGDYRGPDWNVTGIYR